MRNHIQKNIDFSSKIKPESIKKLRKSTLAAKICTKTLHGAPLSLKRRVFDDSWAPAGSQNHPKSANFAGDDWHVWRYSFKVVPRVCPEMLWDRSGRPWGRSEGPPGRLLEAFWNTMPKKICCKNICKNRIENLMTNTAFHCRGPAECAERLN